MRLGLATAGESHGPEMVTVFSGLPAGLRLDRRAIDRELARRQHGHGRGGRIDDTLAAIDHYRRRLGALGPEGLTSP